MSIVSDLTFLTDFKRGNLRNFPQNLKISRNFASNHYNFKMRHTNTNAQINAHKNVNKGLEAQLSNKLEKPLF